MIPRPDYIYKCSHCDGLLSLGSLISGNTFGAVLYSDGKSETPMLPEFPTLSKCRQCNSFVWVEELEMLGSREFHGSKNKGDSEWSDAQELEFLDLDDYFKVLDSLAIVDADKEKEFFVRRSIWMSYNDRIRHDKRKGLQRIFKDAEDEVRWSDNVEKMVLVNFN